MPDPIGSCTDDYASRNFSSAEDLTCHDGPLASPAASPSAAPSAERTSSGSGETADISRAESSVQAFHAEAHAEPTDLYAGAFALRGRDASSGIDIEVFSASAHKGDRESAMQVGMARMGGTMFNGHLAASGEVFTAQSHATFDSPDGSTGVSASAGVTVVGGEVTLRGSDWSVTGGVSVGATLGGSLGLRDIDDDGKPELCGRVDFGLGSLGACIEKAW